MYIPNSLHTFWPPGSQVRLRPFFIWYIITHFITHFITYIRPTHFITHHLHKTYLYPTELTRICTDPRGLTRICTDPRGLTQTPCGNWFSFPFWSPHAQTPCGSVRRLCDSVRIRA